MTYKSITNSGLFFISAQSSTASFSIYTGFSMPEVGMDIFFVNYLGDGIGLRGCMTIVISYTFALFVKL